MKFDSKIIFNALFVLTTLVTIWVGAIFASKMVMYMRFSHHTTGRAIEWGVISLDEQTHRVCLDYTFSVAGKSYSAQHMFLKPTYKNKDAATYAKEAKEKEIVDVWYLNRGVDKEPLSVVDRIFPFNEMMRLFVVFAIQIYFFFLKNYFRRFSTNDEGSESTLRPSKSTS